MRFGRIFLGIAACAFLNACMTAQAPEVSKRVVSESGALPPMKVFRSAPVNRGIARSNTDIFEEFLDLTFSLESGHNIPRLSRFEGPISVSLRNAPNNIVGRDLDSLISRLKSEAHIPIRRVSAKMDANIVIEMISKRQLNRAAPNAACIVVPRVGSWAEYRKSRFSRKSDWTSLDERTRVAVFMPLEISPQEARDCLHEEIAQALGPLNDLYRVPDTVYNDDNFNIVLTSYDMMILRAFYAPELRSGMAKHAVAAVLPRVLARVNPAGAGLPPRRLPATPNSWARQIEKALGARTASAARVSAATQAIDQAKRHGISDHRLGFSYYARARVSAHANPAQAAADYARSYAIFAQSFGPYDIHTAHAALQMASLSLSSGNFKAALGYIEPSLVAANSAQDGQLLFSLLAMKAEIYQIGGRTEEARELRKDAVAWGQYGVYPTSEIKERLELIGNLVPSVIEKEG